jgi:hypothetical protein
MVEETPTVSERRPDTACPRRCFIPIPTVSRSPELYVRSSDSYGYHFRSTSASRRLRIPPPPGMLVRYPGYVSGIRSEPQWTYKMSKQHRSRTYRFYEQWMKRSR